MLSLDDDQNLFRWRNVMKNITDGITVKSLDMLLNRREKMRIRGNHEICTNFTEFFVARGYRELHSHSVLSIFEC